MKIERRIVLYNADAPAGSALREAVRALPLTRMAAEVAGWDHLTDVLGRLTVDALIVHLDPAPHEIVRTIVRRCADEYPNIPMVAVSENTVPSLIVEAMQAGCQQFVVEPFEPAELARAVDRVAFKRGPQAAPGRRICVLGASGGVGATTLCCNLAMEIGHLTNKDCALVDLKLEFGDVANNFDCVRAHSIAGLCAPNVEIDAALLAKSITTLPCRVAVLARPNDLEDAQMVTDAHVGAILRLLGEYYENTIVDAPARLSGPALTAVRSADAILLVLQLTVPSIRNATRLYRGLIERGTAAESIHVVVNRYHLGVGHFTPKDLEDNFDKPVYAVIPNDYESVTGALNAGHPLLADAPHSAVRLAIWQLASRLLGGAGDEGAAAAGAPHAGGLFGRLFGR